MRNGLNPSLPFQASWGPGVKGELGTALLCCALTSWNWNFCLPLPRGERTPCPMGHKCKPQMPALLARPRVKARVHRVIYFTLEPSLSHSCGLCLLWLTKTRPLFCGMLLTFVFSPQCCPFHVEKNIHCHQQKRTTSVVSRDMRNGRCSKAGDQGGGNRGIFPTSPEESLQQLLADPQRGPTE